jgi:hypothetical protein
MAASKTGSGKNCLTANNGAVMAFPDVDQLPKFKMAATETGNGNNY